MPFPPTSGINPVSISIKSKVAKELSVAKLTVPPGSFSMATILEANIGKYVLLKCKEKVVHGKVLNVSNVGDEWSFVMLEVQKSKNKKADIFMKTSDICNVEASDERDGDVYDNDFSEARCSDKGCPKNLLIFSVIDNQKMVKFLII